MSNLSFLFSRIETDPNPGFSEILVFTRYISISCSGTSSSKSIRSKTERDVVSSVFTGFEKSTLDSNSDKELVSRLKEGKANLEKVQKEKAEKRSVELETLYSQKRVLESFSKEENKEALLKYHKDQQEVIKSYFSLLWKENTRKKII